MSRAEPDKLPFQRADPGFGMHLRPLPDGAQWLEHSPDHEERLVEKTQLPDSCYASLDGWQDAESAAAGFVNRHLGRQGQQTNEPLLDVALAIEEDLCVLVNDDGSWRLVAGTLHQASLWSLQDKLGKELLALHAPVDTLAEKIGERMRRFFNGMDETRVFERHNWSVVPKARRYLPPGSISAYPDDPGYFGDNCWLRIERQTLRRVAPGIVLFTINVHTRPLATLSALQSEDLVTAIGRLDAPERHYKRVSAFVEPLTQWQRSRRPH